MPESPSQKNSRWIQVGLWLLVLLPILGCAKLVAVHAVDQRFLDDFVWAQDLIKWVEGKPKMEVVHDIFEVHLEHRPAVARALTLFSTLALHGNVEGQNVLSFLWLLIAFFAVSRLWMGRGGLIIREAWLPLLLAATVAFSPMQWQTLLWPICHGTALPLPFLALSLVTAFQRWPWWVRALTGTLLAVLGMLSFASGFLIWVLPLPVYLICGRFTGMRQRIGFVAIWGLVFAVAMGLYLQVKILPHDAAAGQTVLASLPGGHDVVYDLRNEVPPQYAYGRGEENTMDHGFSFFMEQPMLCIQFMATFSGALLTRGWSADFKTTAGTVGWMLIASLLAAAVYCIRNWKDENLRARLFPMLCFGAYTPVTGFMVAMGRAFAGGTGTALNGRYSVHQTVLVVALIGAAVFIGRHWIAKRAEKDTRRYVMPTGWILAGVLGGIVIIGWIHGASMMREWQAARYRAQASQYLSQVMDKFNPFVAFAAGNQAIAAQTAYDLNRLGLLKGGLASSRKLSTFKIAGHTPTLNDSHGSFDRLFRITNKDHDWKVMGFTYLPGSMRPADAVLLTYKDEAGEWIIFGMTQAYGVPYYLNRSMGKDMYAIIPGRDPWSAHIVCPWDRDVYIHEDPPPGARITAWALDQRLHQIHRVCHFHEEMVKGKPVAVPDGDEGSTLEELAREDE